MLFVLNSRTGWSGPHRPTTSSSQWQGQTATHTYCTGRNGKTSVCKVGQSCVYYLIITVLERNEFSKMTKRLQDPSNGCQREVEEKHRAFALAPNKISLIVMVQRTRQSTWKHLLPQIIQWSTFMAANTSLIIY